MSNLLISAAVNIGVGLLLNFLFPTRQPDITQIGPRLSDLDVTSSAFGQPIPIHYGTLRTGGNVIWSPGIQEVANTTTQSAGGGKGGGGGGSVSTTTFTYFASFALGFSEGPAEEILRIWADGKLIYDITGSGIGIGTLKFRFHLGTETQQPDPLIEADKGVGNVPAHRGLCYIVFDSLPLANFGNRIPNITAEITFNVLNSMPFTPLVELAGQNIPGSVSGADGTSHMFLDPFSDDLYFLKAGVDAISRNSVGSMTAQVIRQDTGEGNALFSETPRYCMNGRIYSQFGSSNFENFEEVEPTGMQLTGFSFGLTGTVGPWGDPFKFPVGSEIGVLQVGDPEFGVPFKDIYVISANTAALGDGGFVIVYFDQLDILIMDNHLDTDIGRGGRVMQDFHNRRIFVTQENDTTLDLYEVEAKINIGTFGPYVDIPSPRLVGTFAKGGAQYAGTDDTEGWCFLPDEAALILSNGVSMFKVDVDDGTVLATNLNLGFFSQDQWANAGKFAFGNGHPGAADGGIVSTIDTEDLSLIVAQDLGDASFPDGLESNYKRAAYDPRSHSIILSRVNLTDPSANRVVRILLQRGAGQGVGLDTIVNDLSLRTGLVPAEINVTALAGTIVQGFSVTRQSPVRSAIEPLMRGFLFEGVESDFVMKFVTRGGASALTVDPDFLGRLTTDQNDEFVKEVRVQEVELPMRVSVQYADRAKDYQQGSQYDKRVQNPTASMQSGEEMSLTLPIILTEQEAKRLAQRWLYTLWSERASISSILPWKYIRLDPTDIFEVLYRGDIRRLRIGRVELGSDLDIDFTSTQEDTRSDDSDLLADGGLGHIDQFIPSGLPSRWMPLDIPLLTADEASLQQFNRAFWAAAGFDSTWPGMILFQSRDSGSSFLEISATSVQASWGVTKGAIATPGTTFTFDESSTIDVQVVAGVANFQTSTDLEVLNGVNAIAVIGPNGPEIIQFVNVTSIDVGTVRLSRLLRGRRGTDISRLTDTHVVGEQVVLLDVGSILTFQNPLELIGISVPYKPVTLNTLLEDAPTIHTIFTGQDLKPYSVVNVATNLAGRTADLSVSWERRTRYNGEQRDGTGEVPLNEASELYDIEYDFGGTEILEKTNLTAKLDIITVAEYTALSHPDGPTARLLLEGEVALVNPDFEQGTLNALPTGWTQSIGLGVEKVDTVPNGGGAAQVGAFATYFGVAVQTVTEITQTADLVALGWDIERFDIDLPTVEIKYFHMQVDAPPNEDDTQVQVRFLAADDTDLGGIDSGVITPAVEDTWEEKTFTLALIQGTRKLKIQLKGLGVFQTRVAFDNIRLRIVGSGVPPLQAKIYQISDVVGRGRVESATV